MRLEVSEEWERGALNEVHASPSLAVAIFAPSYSEL